MRRHRTSSPTRPQLVSFLSNLSLDSSSNKALSENLRLDEPDVDMSNATEDSPPDEGFHEPWPPFTPLHLMKILSIEQSTDFIKEWLQHLPTEALLDIANSIAPRLHRDFIRDLPQELKYEVLSYLDVSDLANSMAVSPTWFEICSYPLLWKELYLKEGWTVAEEVMEEFETQLLALQNQFEAQFRRRRQELIDSDLRRRWITANSFEPEHGSNDDVELENSPPGHLEQSYNVFVSLVQKMTDGLNNYQLLKSLHQNFKAIALVELGETVYRAATFTLNSRSTPRLQVDWRYLYSHRSLLENNWRGGAYQATLLDGAPDVTQPNQREGIYCVYFDRTYLAVGSRDNYIRLFRMSDLAHVNTLKSHEGSVLCLQLDSRKNLLVSGSSDSTLKIWQLEPPQLLQTLRGHSESVLGLQFLDKYIVSCSRDSSARIWEFCRHPETDAESDDDPSTPYPKYVLRKILKGHRAAVNSVHVKDDIIATASGDRTVRLWCLSTGASIRTISYHPRGIACVNIIGQLVVTGSSDHVIRIFSQNTGEEVRALRGHSGLVRTIQTDSTKIISGSYDQSIRVWDIKSGDILHEFSNCHESKIFRVHRDQRRIVSCCGNAKIGIWDFAPQREDTRRTNGNKSSIIDATFF